MVPLWYRFGVVPARSPGRRVLDGRGMDLGLKDRSVLITGGSGGIGDIGLATAHAFAAEGCALHLAARTPEKLRAARDGISRRLRDVPVTARAVDLGRTENALRLAVTCADVEVLVNDAGAIRRQRRSSARST